MLKTREEVDAKVEGKLNPSLPLRRLHAPGPPGLAIMSWSLSPTSQPEPDDLASGQGDWVSLVFSKKGLEDVPAIESSSSTLV